MDGSLCLCNKTSSYYQKALICLLLLLDAPSYSMGKVARMTPTTTGRVSTPKKKMKPEDKKTAAAKGTLVATQKTKKVTEKKLTKPEFLKKFKEAAEARWKIKEHFLDNLIKKAVDHEYEDIHIASIDEEDRRLAAYGFIDQLYKHLFTELYEELHSKYLKDSADAKEAKKAAADFYAQKQKEGCCVIL